MRTLASTPIASATFAPPSGKGCGNPGLYDWRHLHACLAVHCCLFGKAGRTETFLGGALVGGDIISRIDPVDPRQ
jgi:hypothetical protein